MGKHGAVSEHVEGASLAPQHQPGLDKLLLGEPLLHQPVADLRRGRGGADAEAADHRVRQSALLQVVKNRGTFRLPEKLMVHPRRRAVGQVDALLERAALFIGRVVLHLGQGHVKLIRQKGHRLRKGQALNVHDKTGSRRRRPRSRSSDRPAFARPRKRRVPFRCETGADQHIYARSSSASHTSRSP